MAIPAGAFYAPQNTPQGFYINKDYVFLRKAQKVRVPVPAGPFYTPQNMPQGVSRGQSSVSRKRNPSLGHAPYPADVPDWCHQVPVRLSLPHVPGVRMTAVTTNSLKLLCGLSVQVLGSSVEFLKYTTKLSMELYPWTICWFEGVV